MIRKVVVDRIERTGELVLSSIIRKIRELGYPLEGHMISYYDNKQDLYIYAGKYPIVNEQMIPKECLT